MLTLFDWLSDKFCDYECVRIVLPSTCGPTLIKVYKWHIYNRVVRHSDWIRQIIAFHFSEPVIRLYRPLWYKTLLFCASEWKITARPLWLRPSYTCVSIHFASNSVFSPLCIFLRSTLRSEIKSKSDEVVCFYFTKFARQSRSTFFHLSQTTEITIFLNETV